MTHQSFQKGQNETLHLSWVHLQAKECSLNWELGNLSVCPATVTTGSEALGKTPKTLRVCFLIRRWSPRSHHTWDPFFPQPKGNWSTGGSCRTFLFSNSRAPGPNSGATLCPASRWGEGAKPSSLQEGAAIPAIKSLRFRKYPPPPPPALGLDAAGMRAQLMSGKA